MKTKSTICLTAVLALTGLYIFNNSAPDLPADLRDAVADNFGADTPVVENDSAHLPMPMSAHVVADPEMPAARRPGKDIAVTKELIQRLTQTELTNNSEVIESLHIPRVGKFSPDNFILANPFQPFAVTSQVNPADLVEVNGIKNYKVKPGGKIKFFYQDVVHQWFINKDTADIKNEVCAFQFTDAEKSRYVLKTFNTPGEARQAGFTVTHKAHCGTCSSLKDLATYLDNKNLTVPARDCSKKMSIEKIKECYMESIGFTETCAEAWAYNSVNTKKACLGICIKDYGLFNLIANRYPAELNNPDGSLKPCLQCDELRSVPGYMYSVGRTRRGSGIISDIERNPNEMSWIDYGQYYDLFGLQKPGALPPAK